MSLLRGISIRCGQIAHAAVRQDSVDLQQMLLLSSNVFDDVIGDHDVERMCLERKFLVADEQEQNIGLNALI